MSGEGYAPKSPDLSSFFSTPAPIQQPEQIPPPYPQYSQSPPQLPYQQQQQPPPQPGYPQQQPPPAQQPYYQPAPQSPQGFYVPPGSVASPQSYGLPGQQPPTSAPHLQQQQDQYYQGYGGSPQFQQYGLPPQGYQQPGTYAPDSYQTLPPQQPPPQSLGQQQQQQHQLHPDPATNGPQPPLPQQSVSPNMPPRKSAGGQAGSGPSNSVIAPSPVKTKFPTARIKRIMQADEEVGKVSQQTPIAVGKALELFMIALVTKSADVAKTKSSKRVTAQMLKQVVESDDQWDFLRDIVKKVDPDEKHSRAGRNSTGAPDEGVKPKAETDSDEEPPKKRGRPGRKKKVA